MTQAATMPSPQKLDTGEKDYDAAAILASATDTRGVICYVNDDFAEVSGFEQEKLLSAPHKIVRHPDMPRGIFHALWQRLNEGKATSLYIQNLAADGLSYWVFATITPSAEGFVSVRIKPKTQMFDEALTIYDDLRTKEAAGLSAEGSAQLFYEHLAAAGYDDFGEYARRVLACEIAERKDIADASGEKLQQIEVLSDLVDQAQKLTDQIVGAFRQVRGEPVNLRILAGRMEDAGAAISTISKNYESMAGEMHQSIQRLNGTETGILAEMHMSVSRGRSAGQIAALMQAALQTSTSSNSDNTADGDPNGLIRQHAQALDLKYREAMVAVTGCGRSIPDICRQLRRRIKGLDLVKLLCKVESGRIGYQDNGLNGIIDRLELAHESNDRFLSELSTVASQIHNSSRVL